MTGSHSRAPQVTRSELPNQPEAGSSAPSSGAVDESAFTGMFAGHVGVAAWELWVACGHRGGSPAYRAGFAQRLRESVNAMAVMREALPTWVTWLKA
ncbi:hypothetical protein EV562_11288 [Streptomyces sp. BK208]|uniref:hypothetical protein n=1 Tax=Streptomyces sp. BK208 TaxID=2512150 RepID=UPI00105C4F04|nr:hypothetical protein [Streptomyces sp. BK208]TDT30197.1 hypothetical protein EV562_11288 [Streptomyces sp. BK208]